MSKLITVFGSTGSQGNSVVQSLLANGGWKVRALTRDPTSEKSKKLIEQGVQVVKFDESDSKEDIKKALTGSDGVFLVTNVTPKEAEYGIKIADAAFEEGIQHFVFSGLAPCNKISNGRLHVSHFDNKYKVEEHIRSLSAKKDSFKSSFVYAAFYNQNFSTFFKIKKNEGSNDNGGYSISLPLDPAGKPLDLVDITDIGSIVTGILSNVSEYSGKVVPLSGDALSGQQIADTFSKITGKSVSFNYIPTSIFKTFAGEEFAAMFDYYNEFGAFHTHDKSIAPKIHKLTTLEQYLTKINYKLE